MTDLTLDGVQYYIGKMNAKQQFHVARRLAPVIAKLGEANAAAPVAPPVAVQGEEGSEANSAAAEAAQATVQSRFYAALVDAVAELSEENCDYVIAQCMSVVRRRHGESLLPVWNKQSDQPQFADMTLGTLIQLTLTVITSNLEGFTLGLAPTGPPLFSTPPNVH